jgi:hypothetical protein
LISTFFETTATACNNSAIASPGLNVPCFPELETILQGFLGKASKFAAEGTSISLDCIESSNLLIFAQATIEAGKMPLVDPVKHPAHPQVTSFKKLNCAKVERSGTTLNAEECLIIVNILALQTQNFQEYKRGREAREKKHQILSVNGGIGSLEVSISPTLSRAKGNNFAQKSSLLSGDTMKHKTFNEMSQLIPEITNRSDSIRKTLPPVLPTPTIDGFKGILSKLTKPELAGNTERLELTVREAAILFEAHERVNQDIITLKHSLKIAKDYGKVKDLTINIYTKVNSIYTYRVQHLAK